jgi:hypothetical protein
MNKQIVLSIALCTASSTAFAAGTFETWNGADENVTERIQTGLGNQTETNGLWFDYTDAENGGRSKYKCPFEIDPPFNYCDTDGLLMECEGFCGTAILDKGTMTSNPYIGFGFNIVGETSSTDYTLLAGDASTWGGLCVTYTSDADLQLELGLGPTVDSTISYANPAVTLPAAKAPNILRATENKNHGNKVVVSWSDFRQPSWYNGSVKIDGETAAKQLVAVKFKLQSEPGNYDFNICAVGPKDGTCPEKCGIYGETGIKIVRAVSAPKAILNGRMLGFTGIKSTATAEVMNSLGQVVAKSAIEGDATTLNLSHLDAGIYLVRVTGKSANFTSKITLN